MHPEGLRLVDRGGVCEQVVRIVSPLEGCLWLTLRSQTSSTFPVTASWCPCGVMLLPALRWILFGFLLAAAGRTGHSGLSTPRSECEWISSCYFFVNHCLGVSGGCYAGMGGMC